mgnify:CR=1 FL=1
MKGLSEEGRGKEWVPRGWRLQCWGYLDDNGINDGSCSHDASCGYYVIYISGNGRYIVD